MEISLQDATPRIQSRRQNHAKNHRQRREGRDLRKRGNTKCRTICKLNIEADDKEHEESNGAEGEKSEVEAGVCLIRVVPPRAPS